MKMQQRFLLTGLLVLTLLVSFTGTASAVVAGAGYTTFDAVQGGCLDSPNGIDCNNYRNKNDVYMNGGPVGGGGLSDGLYYFSVLVPGYQNGGFVDGAKGNLSDKTKGGTTGDKGTGDLYTNRTFHVTGGLIDAYAGTHKTGTSLNGKFIIQLMPYDDTSNNGNVYILAVCQVGATSPSQCKYDAFRVKRGQPIVGPISGGKYYDANQNGKWDAGEVGISGWPIDYTDGVSGTLTTDANGLFSVSLPGPDTYHFAEKQAMAPWFQTGNTTNQSSSAGMNFAVLNGEMTYDVTIVDSSSVSGIYFGNVCALNFNGRTPGFWQGPNGQELIDNADLEALSALHLVWPDGKDFDPYDKADLIAFNSDSNAQNMASQLSRHLAALLLNVRHGFVDGSAVVFGDGRTVNQIIADADALLAADGYTPDGDPNRPAQAAIKDVIASINEGTGKYVPATPDGCPAPVFQ